MEKRLLNKKGVKYKDLKVDSVPELRKEMMQRSQRRTVPQIFIGDKHIGGFDELYALERKNRLDPLLTSI